MEDGFNKSIAIGLVMDNIGANVRTEDVIGAIREALSARFGKRLGVLVQARSEHRLSDEEAAKLQELWPNAGEKDMDEHVRNYCHRMAIRNMTAEDDRTWYGSIVHSEETLMTEHL